MPDLQTMKGRYQLQMRNKTIRIVDKAGTIPYTIFNGELWICLVHPTDARFGGNSPQICKGFIDDEDDIWGYQTAKRELKEETGLKAKDFLILDTYNMTHYNLHIWFTEIEKKISFNMKDTDGEVIPNWYRIPTALRCIRKEHKIILIDFISSLV
jgi:8-oxo-dGTP pyrophosphatase MutT (NUDIX family)